MLHLICVLHYPSIIFYRWPLFSITHGTFMSYLLLYRWAGEGAEKDVYQLDQLLSHESNHTTLQCSINDNNIQHWFSSSFCCWGYIVLKCQSSYICQISSTCSIKFYHVVMIWLYPKCWIPITYHILCKNMQSIVFCFVKLILGISVFSEIHHAE